LVEDFKNPREERGKAGPTRTKKSEEGCGMNYVGRFYWAKLRSSGI